MSFSAPNSQSFMTGCPPIFLHQIIDLEKRTGNQNSQSPLKKASLYFFICLIIHLVTSANFVLIGPYANSSCNYIPLSTFFWILPKKIQNQGHRGPASLIVSSFLSQRLSVIPCTNLWQDSNIFVGEFRRPCFMCAPFDIQASCRVWRMITFVPRGHLQI